MFSLVVEKNHKSYWDTETGEDSELVGKEVFLYPFFCWQDFTVHDLPWIPKGRSELLVKEEEAKKPPEARSKKTEKLIRKTAWDQIKGMQA